MQAGENIEVVLEADIEHVALLEGEAPFARGLRDAKALGRLAVDLDGSIVQPQHLAVGRSGHLCGHGKTCRTDEE